MNSGVMELEASTNLIVVVINEWGNGTGQASLALSISRRPVSEERELSLCLQRPSQRCWPVGQIAVAPSPAVFEQES
jgi:hypothetical protein